MSRCLRGVQLASALTGTRLVTLAIVSSSAFGLYQAWPAAEEPSPAAVVRPVTYSYVPLLGDPTREIEDAREQQGAGCAPFIAPLIAHPNWSLQIADGASGCMGDYIRHTYEVRADGSASWTRINMPARVLHLTAPELALITRSSEFPCGRTDPVGYSFGWMRIAPGGDPTGRGAAVVPSSSLAGMMLDAVLTGAVERYRTQRLVEIGAYELHLTGIYDGRRYRIDMDGTGRLLVRRGKREMMSRLLEPAERVDAFDFLATRIGAVRSSESDVVAHGSLVAAGVRLPIAVGQFEDPQLEVVWRALADASELESRR